MLKSLEQELSSFIRVLRILVPATVFMSLGMVIFSWPERGIAWFIFVLSLIFGFLIFRHTQMARRALRLIKYGRPEKCIIELRIESGDSRDFIHGLVSHQYTGKKWDVLFTPPGWKVDSLVNKAVEAEAYFESVTDHPLIVLTEKGNLWAERIPERVNT